jgi:restriction system protein
MIINIIILIAVIAIFRHFLGDQERVISTLESLEKKLIKKKEDHSSPKNSLCKICKNFKSDAHKICSNCKLIYSIKDGNNDTQINLAINIQNYNNEALKEGKKKFFLSDAFSLRNVLNNNKTGFDFENYVLEILLKLGHIDARLTKHTNDGGRDIIVTLENEITYIECKRYTNGSVGSPVVRKLAGAMMENNINRGIIITTSNFTTEARKISNLPIELLTWDNFVRKYIGNKWLTDVSVSFKCQNISCKEVIDSQIGIEQVICDKCGNSQRGLKTIIGANRILKDFGGSGRKSTSDSSNSYEKYTCPKCGGKLNQITPRNRQLTKFIGCSNYPLCDYSRKRF